MTTTLRPSGPRRTELPAATVDPARLGRALAIVIALLATAHAVGLVLRFGLGHDTVFGLVPLFNLETESSIPTWFAEILLFACAATLALVAWRAWRTGDPLRVRWTVLAAIFTYLSADEAAIIHERVAEPVRRTIEVGGLFHMAWVVPGLLLVTVVGLWYLPLVRALPAGIRSGTVRAGLLYVGGALGLEMLEGLYVDLRDLPLDNGFKADLGYALMASVEEVMELAGAALYLTVLVRYLAAHRPVGLRFAAPRRSGDLPTGS